MDERKKRYSVLASIMLGSIMGPIDASIINVALPTITQSFGVGIATAQWVSMIYLLSISSLLLFYGRLGDIVGYKKVYLSGLAGFVIASIFCGFAPTAHSLIFFRAIQGLVAGMMMAVPFAIIMAIFPASERGKVLGINAISISAGLAIGPSLGGFLTSYLGWRSVFFLNIPIGCMALFWGYRIIPELKGHPGKMDIPGVVTGSTALTAILLLLNRLQSTGFDFLAIVIFLLAAISSVLFILIEQKAVNPMLNLTLFQNRTFSFANISALLNYMAQYVMVFLTPFYLQRVLLYAPNQVGLVMTAFPFTVMAVAPISGSLSDRIGTRILAFLGAGICALSLFFMHQLSVTSQPSEVVWRLMLFGVGNGIFQSPNNSAVMGSVPRPYLGIASGVLATMRNVGMVMGVAAGGAILYAFVPFHTLQGATFGGMEKVLFLSGLRHAYLAGAIIAAVASLSSLMRNR
ncbi:MAG: MFS transporter [Candidatus Ratteibacteria bacterium]